jgi:hypothetical protein
VSGWLDHPKLLSLLLLLWIWKEVMAEKGTAWILGNLCTCGNTSLSQYLSVRGEDDTNFERQSALFALSVADVLLVNIWCHDIGREHGSGKPLLKTIFQVRM